MLAPPAATPYPTVLLRGLTGPPVEDGQLPTGFPPPMDSRFPEEKQTHVELETCVHTMLRLPDGGFKRAF